MSKIRFSVNDRQLETHTSEMTVSEVLEHASESADHCDLTRDGTQVGDRDQRITIHDGDHFETTLRGKGSVRYEVNGERQAADQRTLTLEEILRRAGRPAAIDEAQIGDYYLQNVADGLKYQDLSTPVTIREGDKFIAVHCGRTPVA